MLYIFPGISYAFGLPGAVECFSTLWFTLDYYDTTSWYRGLSPSIHILLCSFFTDWRQLLPLVLKQPERKKEHATTEPRSKCHSTIRSSSHVRKKQDSYRATGLDSKYRSTLEFELINISADIRMNSHTCQFITFLRSRHSMELRVRQTARSKKRGTHP